jgi:hypothetical protein
MPICRYVWPLVRLAQRHGSPEKAGQRVAFLAWSPRVDEYTGAYFEGRPISKRLSARELDTENQEQAWRLAADLVTGAHTGRSSDRGPVFERPEPRVI